jgi:hypothetical protein
VINADGPDDRRITETAATRTGRIDFLVLHQIRAALTSE